jgi:hypothetical protein
LGAFAVAKRKGGRGDLKGSEDVLAMQESVDQLRILPQPLGDDAIDDFQNNSQEIVVHLHLLLFPSRTAPLLGSLAQSEVPKIVDGVNSKVHTQVTGL